MAIYILQRPTLTLNLGEALDGWTCETWDLSDIGLVRQGIPVTCCQYCKVTSGKAWLFKMLVLGLLLKQQILLKARCPSFLHWLQMPWCCSQSGKINQSQNSHIEKSILRSPTTFWLARMTPILPKRTCHGDVVKVPSLWRITTTSIAPVNVAGLISL